MKKYINYKNLFVFVLALGVFIYGKHEVKLERNKEIVSRLKQTINFELDFTKENIDSQSKLIRERDNTKANQIDYMYGFLTMLILIGGVGYINEKRK